MGKTNFTKVETSLEEGMRRMEISRLLNEADKASGKTPPPPPEEKPKLSPEKRKLIKDLELNIVRLRSRDRKIFSTLKVKYSTVKKMIGNALSLKEEDWKHLATLLKKTDALIKERMPEMVDDKVIESEKEKHINKRFNVNEKWLPLQ